MLFRSDVFVELHVEQGRALEDTEHPVGVAGSLWPHGRWRMDLRGRADHAGTTRTIDRADPMVPLAHAVLAARAAAERHNARATVAKAHITPNGTNAIPSLVSTWLDARAADRKTLEAVVEQVRKATERAAHDHGVDLTIAAESFTPLVEFSHELRDHLAEIVANRRPETAGPVPILPTGAGHDAGVMSGHVPTAMLYVRNPTGVSHSPDEWARPEDCRAGMLALADVLQDLLSRPGREDFR